MEPLVVFTKKIYVEAVHGACNRRLLDAQKIASYFERNGWQVVQNAPEADILFLITCGVSLERESTSLRRISSLKRLRGELIVSGCLPAINRQKVSSLHQGISIPTHEIDKIDEYFHDSMKVKFTELGDANRYYEPSVRTLGPNLFHVALAKLTSLTRLPLHYIVGKEVPRLLGKLAQRPRGEESVPYTIRISWGCSHQCSYCGIRSAVGKFHSKAPEICLDEFKAGLDSGHNEFELIADDVGAYGIDIQKTLPELLNLFLDIRGDYTLQIWNLSPIWFVKREEAFMSVLQRGRIGAIHYPVQSGSHKILKAMRRYSDTSRILETVKHMKECDPKLSVTTDIIIGYPGETDEDIDQTFDLLRNSQFDSVHIFLYNDVPTAPSYAAESKVQRQVAIRRIDRIQKELESAGIDHIIMV